MSLAQSFDIMETALQRRRHCALNKLVSNMAQVVSKFNKVVSKLRQLANQLIRDIHAPASRHPPHDFTTCRLRHYDIHAARLVAPPLERAPPAPFDHPIGILKRLHRPKSAAFGLSFDNFPVAVFVGADAADFAGRLKVLHLAGNTAFRYLQKLCKLYIRHKRICP